MLGLAVGTVGRPFTYDLVQPNRNTPHGWMKLAVVRYVAEAILPYISSERTAYAPGFREEVFRSLKKGISEEDVRRALGEPLLKRTFPDGQRIFYYSQQGTPRDNYLVRNVVFDAQGRLLALHTEFYVD